MHSWWWVRLSPETCRVKPLRRIKTQLLHLVGLISLLYTELSNCEAANVRGDLHKFSAYAMFTQRHVMRTLYNLVRKRDVVVTLYYRSTWCTCWYVANNLTYMKTGGILIFWRIFFFTDKNGCCRCYKSRRSRKLSWNHCERLKTKILKASTKYWDQSDSTRFMPLN